MSGGEQGDGWTGRLLRVDLGSGRCRTESVARDWAETFVGARGLAVRHFVDQVDPGVDPLSPANPLILATGPLTGTAAPTASRYVVVTKGPLTGAVTFSNSGGHFGPALKQAGYDLVIVEGAATEPTWLLIDDDRAFLRPARHLWGKGVWETEDLLRGELGMPDATVACIGPAGERLVRFAAIINDRHRAAGRSGVGAVMGSKNLKAMVVRGSGGVGVARPREFQEACWKARRNLLQGPGSSNGLSVYGTIALVNAINEHGALPTRNYREAVFEEAEAISGETLLEQRLMANKACFACTIACGRVTALPGEAADRHLVTTHPRNWRMAAEGPEYENAWALGADIGVGDLDAVIKANWLCNDLGMDPISFGATLAAAMELYETGRVDEAVTGMPLPFGSAEALVAMCERTALRDGFGDALAEGSRRLTERFGAPELHMGVKGQEFPAYDPRAAQGMGLGYATCNRGACHLRAFTVGSELLARAGNRLDPDATAGKAALVKKLQDENAAVDSGGTCLFANGGITMGVLGELLAAATGVDYTSSRLQEAGERTWNLERLFNQAAGFTAADDVLPKRLLEEKIPAGPAAGRVNRLSEMLPEYYALRGWTAQGEPTPETLARLGLTDVSPGEK